MSLYSQYTTNSNLEKTGILLEYGFNSKGLPICIRIARAGGSNAAYQKAMETKVKPYRRQIQTETIETEQLQKLIKEVFCATVVLGWENVEAPVLDTEGKPTLGEDGNPVMEALPFSYKNALRLFTDLPDLFSDVQDSAQRAALFRAEIRESNAGN